MRELRVAGTVYGCDVERNLLTGREVVNLTVLEEATALSRRGSKDTQLLFKLLDNSVTRVPRVSARIAVAFRNRPGLRCELIFLKIVKNYHYFVDFFKKNHQILKTLGVFKARIAQVIDVVIFFCKFWPGLLKLMVLRTARNATPFLFSF
jgi:hypothetical protein